VGALGSPLDSVLRIHDASSGKGRDGKAQLGAPGGADDPNRLVEEGEAKRLQRGEAVEEGALAGTGTSRRTEAELEAADEVVGEDCELLPEVIGLAVARGDGIKGEMLLDLTEGLLVASATGHEVPERGDAEVEVGGDG